MEGDGKSVVCTRSSEDREVRAYHGLTRALINNMWSASREGYEKKLEIQGVGYLGAIAGDMLQLRVGFANEVHKKIPKGLTVTCPDQTHIVIKGTDKQGRPVRRRSAGRPQARAVQGQRHSVRRRTSPPQGRQDGNVVVEGLGSRVEGQKDFWLSTLDSRPSTSPLPWNIPNNSFNSDSGARFAFASACAARPSGRG